MSKISIGLTNPKSPDNVASVLRAAGNYGVADVYYSGQRYPRALALNPRTPNLSRRISQHIPLKGVSSLVASAPKNAQIVCIELVENAQSLPRFQHPENAFYIFGPEDGSISQLDIDRAHAVVYVPTQGCMNLAATVNVVLYDRMAKSMQLLQGVDENQIIRQNRDANNNLHCQKCG